MFISKQFNRLFAAVVLFILISASLFFSGQTQAQSTGLGVVPRKDMNIATGSKAQDTLKIVNLNKKASLKISLSIIDFKSSDETGSPSLQLDQDAKSAPWSLAPLIDVAKEIELGPGETKAIPYTISIPSSYKPGSYYSAIRYSAAGTGEQSVTISASAATLMFVTVPGKANQQLNLIKFGAYNRSENEQNGTFKSFFVTSQPNKIAFLLENAGSVAESPVGSIEIKNIFGKTVKTIPNINPKRSLALIGQTRRFEACIKPHVEEVNDNGVITKIEKCKDSGLLPGVYSANLNAMYGISGSSTKDIEAKVIFWYVPYWSILVLVGALMLVAYVIYWLTHRYKVYKTRQ